MMRSLLLLLFAASGAWAGVAPMECGTLHLGFDEGTGQWRQLTLAGAQANLLGAPGAMDVEVAAPGHPWPEQARWRADPPMRERTATGWRVRVVRRAAQWTITTTYDVPADASSIKRHATLRWDGAEAVKVVGTALRVPGVALREESDAVWGLPGIYPPFERAVRDSVPGRLTREPGWTWSDTGVAYVRSERGGAALLVGYALELDGASVVAEEVKGGVSLVHRFHTQAIVKPGEELAIGAQWIRVVEGGLEAFRQAADEFAEQCNPGPPTDRPEWLEGAVIEELHPWGRLEAWGAGDRGNRMPNIEAQLPYLRDLGVTSIWLLPVSNKPPWVYSLPAFRHIDSEVTTPDQLRSFVETSHRLGLRTLMDLVTYGVRPDSPDVAGLPGGVWCLDEKGERIKAWGGSVLSADCSNSEWRAHIIDLTSYWVREFGCDGFRLDCGGSGQTLNWRPRPNLRANAGTLAGGVGQNALIRKVIRDINPDAVLLPEAGGTCHLAVSDLIFDYPFYMVCREMTRTLDMARWVAQTRAWLAAQQLTHSHAQQASLVRFLENHDTVAAQDFWGVGPSQALVALSALVPGVLLLHQEQEIGFGPDLREWLHLRQALPELKGGRAEYISVTASDPQVLAFLRKTDAGASVVAINFGPAETTCTLTWPQALADALPVCQEARTRKTVVWGESVTIPAYRPLVLTLRTSPRTPDKALAPASAAGSLVVDRVTDKAGEGVVRHTIRLAPVARWFVSTSEGLLLDEFVDRHRAVRDNESHVDATVPLRRCWRPLDQGLWDGGGTASLGVIAADGRSVEVRVNDRANLRDVRIEDPSSVGTEVSVVLETRAAESPFEVLERQDGGAALSANAFSQEGPVSIDPLWLHIANGHYRASFARRHGGTFHAMRAVATEGYPVVGASNVYTDWGLFKKGRAVSTDWETNPRLAVQTRSEATTATFRGRLRGPAWNGVQTGHPAAPATAYRITYETDASPVMRVSFGMTSSKERPGAKAFLAYRIPFSGVKSWEVTGCGAPLRGRPGEEVSKRVFQAQGGDPASAKAVIRLTGANGAVQLRAFVGAPAPPQNVFLFDGGGDTMHLFVALLNGGATPLPAGEERSAFFEIAFAPNGP